MVASAGDKDKSYLGMSFMIIAVQTYPHTHPPTHAHPARSIHRRSTHYIHTGTHETETLSESEEKS